MYSHAYNSDFIKQTLEELTPILHEYLENSRKEKQKVLIQRPIAEILEKLDFDHVIQAGSGDLCELVRVILENSNHMWDPRYIGHQVALPMGPSMFADLLNGVTNNAMPVYEMGPAGSAIERGLIAWLLKKTGWFPDGDGVMTHGGSMANLTCLLAARARRFPEAWEKGIPAGAVVLASEACHYSVSKACAIMGLGTASVVSIPGDQYCRISITDLQKVYEQVISNDGKVIAVVVNGCVTASGVYDSILDVAEFCRKKEVWLHVDGAHGASALLSPKYSHLMAGIELADSLTWDTHKMLGTSGVCGLALFRKKETLDHTFSQHGTYLFTEHDKPGMDISTRTLECTKSLMALKLFFNLAIIGENGMAEHVTRLYDNTRRFHAIIETRKGFHCLCPPEANVLCFSYGNDSKRQDSIRQQLVQDGDFYITRATINKKSYLRLSVMNPFTSDEHIHGLCDRIEELAQ